MKKAGIEKLESNQLLSRSRAQDRVALCLLHAGAAGHAVDYDLVDDSFGAFFDDIENQTHLLVGALVRQVVGESLNLGFDESLARVKVEQPIRIGAFLRRRIRRADHRVDFLPQALFGKNLRAAKLDAGHPGQRSFHNLKSYHHGVLVYGNTLQNLYVYTSISKVNHV